MSASATLSACGGGDKKAPVKPVVDEDAGKKPAPRAETEEDRERKRLEAAHAIVPEGSTCLPASLKEKDAGQLSLGAVGDDAVLCLGEIACWKVDLGSGSLTYQAFSPLPGRSWGGDIHDRCSRGYCLPKDAAIGDTDHLPLVRSPDGAKVAMLAGDNVYIFDAGTKAREGNFSIRGEKGVTNDPIRLYWVGDTIFVEGQDQGPYAAIFAFKADGTAVGPLEAMGAKNAAPLSIHGGSFVVLDPKRVAVSERGFSTVTTYEIASGKRAKLVRKLPKAPCKNDEIERYWVDSASGLPAKCKDHLDKTFGHLVGADAVAGGKSLLVLLRGARTGELAVLDAKSLSEKKSIKLPWCEAGEGEASSKKKAPEDPDAGGE
ncbi:MAG: hypothetical protein ACTHU0_12830 [Kofleriaceae bacterium]